MKKFFLLLFIFFLGIWVLKGFFGDNNYERAIRDISTNVVVTTAEAKDGLEIPALIELVKQSRNVESIERKLNEPNGINNLDLNDDGKVDFIKVREIKSSSEDLYALSFTTEPTKGEEQELCEIEIKRNDNSVDLIARGNEQVYGSTHHYSSSFPIGTMLLWAYLLKPHTPYYSPYGFGRYPSYYSYFDEIEYDRYKKRAKKYYKSGKYKKISKSASLARRSNFKNPNKDKIATSGIRKKLSNPTSTQKQFRARNPSKKVGSGGFGKSRSTSSSKSTTVKKKRFGSSKSSSRSVRSARGFSRGSRGGGGFGGFGK